MSILEVRKELCAAGVEEVKSTFESIYFMQTASA
jgi:hypothetical protein